MKQPKSLHLESFCTQASRKLKKKTSLLFLLRRQFGMKASEKNQCTKYKIEKIQNRRYPKMLAVFTTYKMNCLAIQIGSTTIFFYLAIIILFFYFGFLFQCPSLLRLRGRLRLQYIVVSVPCPLRLRGQFRGHKQRPQVCLSMAEILQLLRTLVNARKYLFMFFNLRPGSAVYKL